jgi:ribose transport system substrate-binding protein
VTKNFRPWQAAAGCAALAASLVLTSCSSSSSSATSSSSSATSSASSSVAAGASGAAPSVASSQAGSSSASASGAGVTIGFSPFNQSAEALIGLGKGAAAYLGTKGAKVLVADPKNDSGTQITQINTWVENGQVQGVWLLSLNTEAMKNTLQTAQRKSVVVVANGTPDQYGFSGPQKGISFDNIDYNQYGSDVGNALGSCLNSRAGGKGQVILLTPAPGQAEAAAVAPFKAALAKTSPGSTIVASTAEGGDVLTAQQNTASALQAHPDAIGVVSFHDEGTQGAKVAFKQAGKTLSKSCLVNAGGATENIADVKTGDLYAVIALDFAADMTQTADLLLKMHQDPTAAGTQLTTPIKVYTATSS